MKINNFDLETDGVYIIAEMSANHNGRLEKALETISAAKDAGADAVKLQTYTADAMTIDSHMDDFIVKGGTLWDGRSLYDLYNEAKTPYEWHEKLFEYAREIGIDIFSTPFDTEAVDFLEQFHPPAYKIASYEITDYNLVRHAAGKMRPMIISTGIAFEHEIRDVVNICKSAGNNNIILLKCTSAYPAPPEDANLLTIPDMANRFGAVTGFSDHTLGITAPVAACALGAKVIEKHFIPDKSDKGVDSDFSLDKQEFTRMVQAVRETEKLLGRPDYEMNEKKEKNRRFARSLYAVRDIRAGEVFTEDNIRSIRPGYGLHPKHLPDLTGKKSPRDIQKGERITHADLKGAE